MTEVVDLKNERGSGQFSLIMSGQKKYKQTRTGPLQQIQQLLHQTPGHALNGMPPGNAAVGGRVKRGGMAFFATRGGQRGRLKQRVETMKGISAKPTTLRETQRE